MAVKFANNVSTSLSAAINATQTTISVADASGLPTLSSGDYVYLTLDTDTNSPTIEVVKVTAISSNDLTVVRGQDGTTASSFSNGTKVELRVTAAALDDISSAADTESVSIDGDTMTGALTISSSGTIGGATVANGYLKITDGTDTLGLDANEIMSTDRLFLNSADGEIFLRGNNSAGVKLFNGGTQFMSASRNLLNIGTISSGSITTSGTVTANGGSASSFYALQLSRSSSGIVTPDIWGTNGTFVIGTSASVEAVGFSGANATFYGTISSGDVNSTGHLQGTKVRIGSTEVVDVNADFRAGNQQYRYLHLVGGATSTSEVPDSEAMIAVADSSFSGLTSSADTGWLVYRPRVSSSSGRSGHAFYTGSPSTLALKIDSSQNATFTGTISSGAITSSGTGTFEGGGNTLTLKKGTGTPAIAFAGTASDPQTTALIEGISGGGLKIYTSSGTISSPSWSPKITLAANGNTTFAGTISSGAITSSGAVSSFSPGSGASYIRIGDQVTDNNPGGWNKGVHLNSLNHGRFRIRTTDHTYGELETYYWADSSVTPSMGIYGNKSIFRFTGSITTLQNKNGDTFWHAANDGSGSGLDADTLDGLNLHTGRNNEVNKVVRTDSNGYIQAGWINTTSGAITSTIDKIYASNDGYIRYITPTNLGAQLSSHINYDNLLNKPTIPSNTNQLTNGAGFLTNGSSETITYVYRIHSSDSTSPDSLGYDNRYQTFNYGVSSGVTGPLISFGGLGSNYPMQITGAYGGGGSLFKVRTRNGDTSSWNGWRTLWHDANDGSGSGLDADLLDGQQGSYYHSPANLPAQTNFENIYNNLTGSTGSGGNLNTAFQNGKSGFIDIWSGSNLPSGTSHVQGIQARHSAGSHYGWQIVGQYSQHQIYKRHVSNSSFSSWDQIWTSATDGSGSGLDADLLDGHDSGSFLRSNVTDNYTSGTLSFNSGTALKMLNGSNFDASSGDVYVNLRVIRNAGTASTDGLYIGYLNSNSGLTRIFGGGQGSGGIYISGSGANDIKYNNSSVFWHAGNDGSGSGLDADLLDGQQGSYYQPASTAITTSNIGSQSVNSAAALSDGGDISSHPGSSRLLYTGQVSSSVTGLFPAMNNANAIITMNKHPGNYNSQLGFSSNGGIYYRNFNNTNDYTTRGWDKVWISTTDGSGSGLDADLLDGQHGSHYLNAANFTGTAPTGSPFLSDFVHLGNANGSGYSTDDGSWGARLNVSSTVHAKIEVSQQADNMRSHWYAHTGQSSIKFGTSTGHDVELQRASGTKLKLVAGGSLAYEQMIFQSGGIGRADHHRGNLVGSYNNVAANSAKTNPIYVIGTAYQPTATSFSNMYGIGYAHNNIWGTANGRSSGWGFYSVDNGTVHFTTTPARTWSLGEFNRNGNTVWDAGNDGPGSGLDADTVDGVHGANFLRSDTSDTFTGNLTTGANNHITFGPNGTWGSYLRIGGNGRTATGTEMASVVTTDGNLHLDAANSANGIYLNYYAGTNGTYFGSGAGGIVARMDSSGQLYKSDGAANPYWNSVNDGSGSGLDADTVDSIQGANIRQINSEYSGSVGTAGWYTIAEYGSGRAQGEFYVHDNDSSRHNYVKLDVSWSFGNGGIVCTGNGKHGVLTITHARLLFNTSDQTYGGCKLQIYCSNPSWTLRVRQMPSQMSGWAAFTQVTPTLANSVSGFGEYSRASDLALNGGISQSSSTIKVSGHQVWHAGNDGSGSGLDADLLDGMNASSGVSGSTIVARDGSGYIYANHINFNTSETENPSISSFLTSNGDGWSRKSSKDHVRSQLGLVWGSSGKGTTNIGFASTANSDSGFCDAYNNGTPTGTWYSMINMAHYGGNHGHQIAGSFYSAGDLYNRNNSNTTFSSWTKIWNAANDGPGSGLDADLLDGQHGSYYFSSANYPDRTNFENVYNNLNTSTGANADLNTTFTGSVKSGHFDCWGGNGAGSLNHPPGTSHVQGIQTRHTTGGHYGWQIASQYNQSAIWKRYVSNGSFSSWHQIWTSGTDGSGSGLDADLLDGYNAAENGGNTIHKLASNGYSQINNWIQVGVTGIYSGTNSAHFKPNRTTSYGSWETTGSRNGYDGIVFGSGGDVAAMFDGSGNGGFFKEGHAWLQYYSTGNTCTAFGASTTSSSYQVYVHGAFYATGNVTAYSDRRVKENIIPIDNALEKVNQLEGVYYNRIDDPDKNREIGFIAQDVNEVTPELVTYAEDVDQYGVKYQNATALLVEAVKMLTQQVKDLQAEIEELKNA